MPRYPVCKHSGPSYKCVKLSMLDCKLFHKYFYENKTKILQDHFLLKYIDIEKPERDRASKQNGSRKKVVIKYNVKVASCDTFKLPVCQDTFLNILNVSKDRVQRIARNHFYTGQSPICLLYTSRCV